MLSTPWALNSIWADLQNHSVAKLRPLKERFGSLDHQQGMKDPRKEQSQSHWCQHGASIDNVPVQRERERERENITM